MRHSTPPPHPRIPIGLIALLFVPLALIVAGILVWAAWQFQQLNPTIASVLRVAVFAIPIGLAIGLGSVAVIAAYNRIARLDIVKADKVIELKRAETQVAPLASSFSYHNAPRVTGGMPVEPEPLALPEPEPPGVPTFAQLLDSGTIGAGRPLLFGFDAQNAQPITGGWLDLYSIGIGGLPGSGKTTAASIWVAQSALAGARIILADPHSGNPESLANRLAPLSAAFVCEPAQTTKEIVAALQLCHDKLRRRAAGQGGHWPLLFICDEWTSLLRTSAAADLPELVKNISQEGRKYGIYAILLAQNWGQDQSGHVRDELCSHLILRTRPELGRHQTGLRASQLPADLLQLAPGDGYLLNNRGDVTKLRIPRLDESDLARVGALLTTTVRQPSQPIGFRVPSGITPSAQATNVATTPSAHVAENRPKSSQNVAGRTAAYSASQTATAASPEATRAAALFVAGSSPADVVRELRGVGSKEGARYQAALAEVLDLIRAGIGGQQL